MSSNWQLSIVNIFRSPRMYFCWTRTSSGEAWRKSASSRSYIASKWGFRSTAWCPRPESPTIRCACWRRPGCGASVWVWRAAVNGLRKKYSTGLYRTKPSCGHRAPSKHISSVAPCYFFIIGNPYEDRQDLLDTLVLMTRMAYPYYTNIYNLVFFPGSELFDRAVRDGMIAGTRDSGFELHFRAGSKYREHAWKQKNLYLNGLLFLTEGKATRRRLGLLPRSMIPFLTRPGVIDFMDRRTTICRIAISSKVLLLRARARLGGVLKRLLKNPADAYNLPAYLMRKFT